jgi:uncharacterized protein (DUF169 family)
LRFLAVSLPGVVAEFNSSRKEIRMIQYEDRHKLRKHDFDILKKFKFKYVPIGFKFLNAESDLEGLRLEQLDKRIAWCQMIMEAQKGRCFYAKAENQFCEPGIFLTGHGELASIVAGGRIGPPFEIYGDERSNRRVYNHIYRLAPGSVFCTAFAPIEELTFDPDLLIITCDHTDQTERVLRAVQYDTGDPLVSKMTYVMACNWMFNYPYVTGNINYLTTGISYGMKMYKLYPPGMQIVSIPWHHIDRVMRNMNEMPWTIPGHTDQKEEFYKLAHARLGIEQII